MLHGFCLNLPVLHVRASLMIRPCLPYPTQCYYVHSLSLPCSNISCSLPLAIRCAQRNIYRLLGAYIWGSQPPALIGITSWKPYFKKVRKSAKVRTVAANLRLKPYFAENTSKAAKLLSPAKIPVRCAFVKVSGVCLLTFARSPSPTPTSSFIHLPLLHASEISS
jgi:hypothetical protein